MQEHFFESFKIFVGLETPEFSFFGSIVMFIFLKMIIFLPKIVDKQTRPDKIVQILIRSVREKRKGV